MECTSTGSVPAVVGRRASVAEDDIRQGAVYLQSIQFNVVVDEAQVAELVHEKADAGARRADHLRQRVLADLRNECCYGITVLVCIPSTPYRN